MPQRIGRHFFSIGGRVTSEVDEIATVLDSVERIRIFPLPSTVLIPGGQLPLHVFEPRYRKLVADALATDRILGIPLLEAGWEADYAGKPPLRPTMGVGLIRAADRMPDGRFNILVEGMIRVRIVEELSSDEPYRVVRAEPIPDRISKGEGPRIQDQAQIVRQLALDLAAAIPDQTGLPFARACIRERDPGRLADLAAAAVLIDTRDRQEFLEEAEVSHRLRVAADALAQTLLHVLGTSGGPPS